MRQNQRKNKTNSWERQRSWTTTTTNLRNTKIPSFQFFSDAIQWLYANKRVSQLFDINDFKTLHHQTITRCCVIFVLFCFSHPICSASRLFLTGYILLYLFLIDSTNSIQSHFDPIISMDASLISFIQSRYFIIRIFMCFFFVVVVVLHRLVHLPNFDW